MRSRHIDVTICLDKIRESAENIRHQTNVGLIAVVKADAYGAGAPFVTDALASVVDEFAYFTVDEAREVGKPGLLIGPALDDASVFRELNLRPTVMSAADAVRYRGMSVAVSVDTGMQRFGCDPNDLDEIFRTCTVRDLYTHSRDASAAERVREFARARDCRAHAAATALLSTPGAWLDSVRPGYALYRGAMRVTARLQAAYETTGQIGYTGFSAPRVGIILAGYSNGLRPAPVMINGRRQRLIEIGMNSSFVTTAPADRPGDEVVLLGDEMPAAEVAQSLGCRPHEVHCRYGESGVRRYVRSAVAATVGCPSMSKPR